LDNLAYGYENTTNPPIRFLNFTEEEFAPIYFLDVKKLEISRNTFINSDAMVEFKKSNYTFTDYKLIGNGGKTCKSIIKIATDPYNKIGF
jgi:hypothetical protein